jgi:hypothetical protein
MKKFLFALLLGVFMVGTLVAEESYNTEKDVPDIVYSVDMPDVQIFPMELDTPNIKSEIANTPKVESVLSVTVDTPIEVGWVDTTNIIYNKEYPATNLYRYTANSNSYCPTNVSFAKRALPDININHRLL